MHYVYILKLKDDSHYTGYSSDLKQRLKDHKEGNVPKTKNKRPLEPIFYAAFKSKRRALHFEKYLKTNSGFAFRNKRLI